MKFSMSSVVVALAFTFVVFFSLFGGCSNVQPYEVNTRNLNGYPYEGFGPMLEYTTYPENQVILSDSYASQSMTQMNVNNERTRVKGFDGLLVSPTLNDASIDVFSKAHGKDGCKDYGLSTSTGFLCLDQNQIGLLTTRGGNATGI